MRKVLLVDDELAKTDESIAFSEKYAVEDFGYLFARDKLEAVDILTSDPSISLVLLDIVFENMRDEIDFERIREISRDIWPDGTETLSGNEYGLPILDDLRSSFPDLPVVMLSSKAVPNILLWCWRHGASHYIIKDPQPEEVRDSLERWSRYLQPELLIGRSEPMLMLKERIRLVASSGGGISVLVTGESGTGKELVARSIHQNGPRREGPFVVVNCAAIPGTLMESELFGHKKGAFTGATSDGRGKIQDADGGVIFLDEIGELNLELQSKVLRAIDRGMRFTPVGSTQEITCDVQVVAATNKNLEEEVAERRFREDLFFRLNVFPIQLPPLRDRAADIPLLSEHFLSRFRATRYRAAAVSTAFSPAALDALQRHTWPGNVRELENAVESALVAASGSVIKREHLPDRVIAPSGPGTPVPDVDLSQPFHLRSYIARVEWSILRQACLLEEPSGRWGLIDRIGKRIGLANAADIQRTILPKVKSLCPDLEEEVERLLPKQRQSGDSISKPEQETN